MTTTPAVTLVGIAWQGKVPVKQVANTPPGFEQMQSRFDSLGTGPVHAVLEATGTYSDAVALFLYEQGHTVSVINPARLAAFRKSEGILTKTDKQDAKLLVRYAQQKQPSAWTPPPPERRQLQVLELRRELVQQMRQQEANHLENSRLDALTCQQITTHLAQLDAQIADLEERAASLVTQQSRLADACELLDSIPSIAPLTARRLLAAIVEISRFERASQLVAYAGVASVEVSSGTSVRGSGAVKKTGTVWLRKWLYMSAFRVMSCDPDFARWAAELKARGKKGLVRVVAMMRKLLHVIYGVLTSGKPYDPRLAFPAHYATRGPAQGEAAA